MALINQAQASETGEKNDALQLLPDIRKLGVKVSICYDHWPLRELRPFYSGGSTSKECRASVYGPLDIQAGEYDANMGFIRLLSSVAEALRQSKMVFSKYAPGYTRNEHPAHERV